MKDNLYTQAIKNVKAPKKLIDNTLDSIYSTPAESDMLTLKTKKHRAIKLTSAIAATLVLIITLSAIFLPGNNTSEHPFVLTVKAANTNATPDEITNKAYVKVGELRNAGRSVSAKNRGYIDENGDYISTDDEYMDLYHMMEEFALLIACTGENIESVTYTAHKNYLTYNPDYEGLLDVVELAEEEQEKYISKPSFNNFKIASSCTFDYNLQPLSPSEEDATEGTIGTDSIPLRMAFYLEFEEGKYVLSTEKDDKGQYISMYSQNLMPIYEKEFNEQADNFSLDITANFTDGTSTTKTLKFKCENHEKELSIYAIEDNS